MKWSEAQLEVWRVRDELARETPGMSPEDLRKYLAKAREAFKAETGVELQVMDRTRTPSPPARGQ